MHPLQTVDEAAATIARFIPAPRLGMVRLEVAVGYVLANSVVAERDHPAFDRATHDGIAIASAALKQGIRQFALQDYAAAGDPAHRLSAHDHAVEIGTGASLPIGCDTIIPYEHITLNSGFATLSDHIHPAVGQSIHPRASDVTAGTEVLTARQTITIPQIALLAGNGISPVPVYQKPRIGILSTGSELVAPNEPLGDHQIRRSNDAVLAASLHHNGFQYVELAWEPDDLTAIKARLAGWLSTMDAIVIIGGISRGKRDFVPQVLDELGVETGFHRVAQRPGKPLWFGKQHSTLVFGLPGNPTSSLVCLTRYVLPALRRMAGQPAVAIAKRVLGAKVTAHVDLTCFVPVTIGPAGEAIPMCTNTSGDFVSVAPSDGIIELAPGVTNYAAGSTVPYYAWSMP